VSLEGCSGHEHSRRLRLVNAPRSRSALAAGARLYRVRLLVEIRRPDPADDRERTGGQALLKVGRDGLKRQFAQRATALADELSIDGVTEEFCAEMYDARSDWVHGAHVRLFTTSGEGPETDEQWRVLGEIAKLQDLLRAVVRRCLEEPAFREIFTSDEAISERWRIAIPERAPKWWAAKWLQSRWGRPTRGPGNPLNKRHRYRDSNPGFRTENSTKTVRSGHLRPCEVL
jgi:hypothetical protein